MNEDILTYARKIKDHNFTAMVGVSAQQWRYENETFVGLNSSTDFIYTMNAFVANLDLSSTGSTLSNHSMASVFARVTYDYKGRYLLNAIMRRDGSSRFAKENKWGNFPSVSVGWRFSDEKFMKFSKEVPGRWQDSRKLSVLQVMKRLEIMIISTLILRILFTMEWEALFRLVSVKTI